MKKLFTTLLIIICIGKLTYAQQKTRSNFEFGISGGYNFSYTVSNAGFYNYYGDYYGSYSSSFKGGYNVGLSGEYYFNELWSLKAKVIYDQKGWGDGSLINDDGTEIDYVDYRLNYVTVPVMANMHFGRTGNWYLNFGPYIGFLTSAKANVAGENLDLKPLFHSVDGGLAVGLGIKIPVSNYSNIFFEYDSQTGLTNVAKPGASDTGSLQLLRGSLNVGLSF
ncbi:MAG: PorT family protein [Mucilaginibacter sp.]|nr:PorT family protein [Mucilaginibacter sp.]